MVEANGPESRRLLAVRADLARLRSEALALEQEFASDIKRVRAPYRKSARNLVHYMAVRRHDVRGLQLELQRLGLSSLGRMEANVLPTLDAVLRALDRLAGSGRDGAPPASLDPRAGDRLLRDHASRMLGPHPKHRLVRIMVTMPSGAADDPGLIGGLLEHGMDIMRINCAHDGVETWARMVANRRLEADRLGRECRVAFDLAGPKLRTGPLARGPEVLKVKPQRDAFGRVTNPARLYLSADAPDADPHTPEGCVRVPVAAALLAAARTGDQLRLRDARGRRRRLTVLEVTLGGCVCTSERTLYLTSGMAVGLYRERERILEGAVGPLPALPQALELRAGDTLRLTRDQAPGENARLEAGEVRPAQIACTLPQVFVDAKPGQRILFDDGKIAGVIRSVGSPSLEVEVTHAVGGAAKLRAEKGINLPDTDLNLSALTGKDLEDLRFIVEHGDMVSLSFVRHREDIEALIAELDRLGGQRLGIILKIENRQAFEHLPDLLLSALQHAPVAVMVARGDLGVEVGFERLAEVQEQILWLCEAAHVPVIWATQVLESLAKRGVPTRAEVTDAAMSGRAECVMLNKGPYIAEAVAFLDNVLRRMKAHQSKKTAMMRRLKVTSRATAKSG